MISISVKTNTTRKTVTAEITSTPRSVFDDLGIDLTGSSVSLSGVTLNATEVMSTFEDLKVADGTEIRLTAVVKGDGAVSDRIIH